MTASAATLEAAALEGLLRSRWSCRAFHPQPVPRGVIVRVLEIARLSPYWCNAQPWHVYVTAGEETERFRAMALRAAAENQVPDFEFSHRYTGVFRDRHRAAARQIYDEVGSGFGECDRVASARQAERNFELFGAPHVAIVTTEASEGVYGAIECGLYVSNFLLAAHSMGLGAIPQTAIAAMSSAVRRFLDLPDSRLVLCGISLGWPDEGHPSNRFRAACADVEDTFTWVQ